MLMQIRHRSISRWLLLLGLGAGVSSATLGCSVAAGQSGEAASTGTVQIALTSRSNSGANYHLANATFAVGGTTTDTLSGDDAVLRRDLPAGDYTVELQAGWALNSVAADGTETPVPAKLTSKNPLSFTIQSQDITHVRFDFQVQGESIEIGDGRLSVALNVDDTSIDDFEADDDAILPVAGRNGGWFSFTDGTSGVMTPALGERLLPTPDGPDGDLVLHVFGGGFTGFGAGVGASLRFDEQTLPYNAAAYAGVRFTYSSASWVRLNVGTTATTALTGGGSCDPATQSCYDDFGISLPPAEQFTSVEIRWTDLSQIGFGTPTTFDASQLLSLKWGVPGTPPYYPSPPVASFDLRLDDVAFISSTPDSVCTPAYASCDPNAPSCCDGLYCDRFFGVCLR